MLHADTGAYREKIWQVREEGLWLQRWAENYLDLPIQIHIDSSGTYHFGMTLLNFEHFHKTMYA